MTSLVLSNSQTSRLRDFIEAHLSSTIRVDDLGRSVALSRNRFSRAFRRTFGQSPYAYVVRRRALRACEMMLGSAAPLSEVAQDCGFADQAHFTRVFRRVVGESPSVWRRQRAG